eukprot:9247740-Karenia_brevis.AAC.1
MRPPPVSDDPVLPLDAQCTPSLHPLVSADARTSSSDRDTDMKIDMNNDVVRKLTFATCLCNYVLGTNSGHISRSNCA